MRKLSVVANLVYFTDLICTGMDRGGQVDGIYTAYFKCFDQLNNAYIAYLVYHILR